MKSPHLNIRFSANDTVAMGPGKADLLDAIIEHQSISAAAKSMQMSYRRAWQLVDLMNQTFQSPLVATSLGGANGGGAVVTPTGLAVLRAYRVLVAKTELASAEELAFLKDTLKLNKAEDL